jgi:hypothetical protein
MKVFKQSAVPWGSRGYCDHEPQRALPQSPASSLTSPRNAAHPRDPDNVRQTLEGKGNNFYYHILDLMPLISALSEYPLFPLVFL